MKTGNLVTQSLRQSETGQCWEEKLSNATGTIELPKCTTFRVRATGATTVTIDGILAMTMSSGEIALFNTGDGNPDDAKPTVTVVIGAVGAFVQVARETYRPRLTV
jgi:hypothetical protein